MKSNPVWFVILVVVALSAASCSQDNGPVREALSNKDTYQHSPNSDTPCSMLQVDLRAEPIVFCVPKVEKGRYYSLQLTDMYSFNYGYVGSRATGNDAGCYLIAGPDWKGESPAGIKKTFRSETQFGLVIYRMQLFNAADMSNVMKIQAGYTTKPLSVFLHQTAPPAPPTRFPGVHRGRV